MKKTLVFLFIAFYPFFLVYAQQTDALFIAPTGHVGLGTNTPLSTLHVKGGLRIDSNMQVLGNLAGQSLNLATTAPNANALRIQAGNFSMGSNSAFSIDAPGISGGRLSIDTAGTFTIPGAISIHGTPNHTGFDLLNGTTRWTMWTSSGNGSAIGLVNDAFEIWEYSDKDANPRLQIYAMGTNKMPKPYSTQVTIDGTGNLYVQAVHPTYPSPSSNNSTGNAYKEDDTLMPLDQVGKFLQKEKHLPGIPNMEQWNEQRISLNELQVKTVEKLEEVTLYLLELKKENQELRQRVEFLEGKKK